MSAVRAAIRNVSAVAHLDDGRSIRAKPPTEVAIDGTRLTFWFPFRVSKGGSVERVTIHLGGMSCTMAVVPPTTFGADSLVTIVQPLDIDSLVPE